MDTLKMAGKHTLEGGQWAVPCRCLRGEAWGLEWLEKGSQGK